jgi:hypothetical protein
MKPTRRWGVPRIRARACVVVDDRLTQPSVLHELARHGETSCPRGSDDSWRASLAVALAASLVLAHLGFVGSSLLLAIT